MKHIICWLLFFSFFDCAAQKTVFTEEEFKDVIIKFHPVARQARIHIQMANTNVTTSRGAFDPVISGNYGKKNYDGINYYDHQQTHLKIPTWYGIDLYTGIENFSGARINPEETKGNLSYVGLNAPILQNLIIDKRRAVLQQAKIFQTLSVVERKIILNDLLEESLKTYWEWWQQFQRVQLIEQALQNADRRFVMVRTAFRLGDRAAIDTLEAFTQVQNFSIRLEEARMDLTNAQYGLSAYLWTDKTKQYDLPEEVIPQALAHIEINADSFLTAAGFHPELIAYRHKLDALKIEKKLKFQLLVPELNVKYNQIANSFSDLGKGGAWFQNNYRYGISFAMPLRLSEGRGAYKNAQLKIADTKLEQSHKEISIRTKLKQYINEWFQTQIQIKLQDNIVRNMLTLQKAEETLFFNGESCLFLINSRELRRTEAEIKQIDLQKKNQATLIKLKAAAGMLGNE